MQHPKMIVLGLLSMGMKYGLEMEEFIERSNMRLWAQIGGSTIYKTLNDLKADDCVSVKLTAAKRGPGKKEFRLTTRGKEQFQDYVEQSLYSEASVYSDRIAGLVFALSLPRHKAAKYIKNTIEGLGGALDTIAREKRQRKSSASARIVLDFYASVYKAEQEALQAALGEIKG